MKKAELEKQDARKVAGGQAGRTTDRFGKDSGTVFDKREQRERERQAGLVPYAVKLHGDLIRELHALAAKRGVGLNELTDELLRKGMKAS